MIVFEYYFCTYKQPSIQPSCRVCRMLSGERSNVHVYNRPAFVLDRTQGCASIGWLVIASVAYNILLPIRHTFTIISLYMLSAGMLFLFTSYRIMQPQTACIIYVRVMSVYFLLKRTSPSGPDRAFYVSFFSKNYPTLAYSLTWLSNVALLINYSD